MKKFAVAIAATAMALTLSVASPAEAKKDTGYKHSQVVHRDTGWDCPGC